MYRSCQVDGELMVSPELFVVKDESGITRGEQAGGRSAGSKKRLQNISVTDIATQILLPRKHRALQTLFAKHQNLGVISLLPCCGLRVCLSLHCRDLGDMASSLAQQLKQTASLNAALFKNAVNRINKRDSYLFTAQEASRHDPESIHGFAYNAFLQLESLDPKFSEYEDDLFSEAVKMQDRTLLNPADNEKLNATLDSFLRLLSGHLFIEASSRVLEWLVRHFRITEFNLDGVMACFLPYHDSPLFVRILSITHLKENRPPVNWAFLEAFKKITEPMPRDSLLVAMEKDPALLRFVVDLLPKALGEGSAHRALINFYTVTLLAFIKKQKTLDETMSAMLLPAFSQILDSGDVDATLGAYMLAVSLARKTRLTSKALKVLLTTLAKSYRPDTSAANLISALVAICASQDELDSVQKKTISALAEISEIDIWLTEASTIVGSEFFLRPVISTMAGHLDDARYASILAALFRSNTLPELLITHGSTVIVRQLATTAKQDAPEQFDALKELGGLLQQKHPISFAASVQSLKDAEDAQIVHQLEGVVAKLSVADATGDDDEASLILGSYSADASVRASSAQRILESFANKEDLTPDVLASLCTALLARIADTEVEVLQVLYADPEKLLDAVAHEDLFTTIKDTASAELPRKSLLLHLTFVSSGLIKQDSELRERALFDIFLPHLLFIKSHNKTVTAVWDLLLSSDMAQSPILSGVSELIKSTIVTEDGAEVKHERLAELNSLVAKKIADNIVTSDQYNQLVQSVVQKLPCGIKSAELFCCLVMKALLARVSGEHQVELGHQLVSFLQSYPDHMFIAGEDVTDKLDEDIYARSKAVRTVRQMHSALLCAVAEVGCPANVRLDLLCNVEQVTERDMRGVRYAALCRAVYRLLSNQGLASPARTQCLKCLFSSLRDDSLLLLAGIWADDSSSAEVRTSALSHGRAILQSHNSGDLVDFQAIVPSLLVALSDGSRLVRSAAVKACKTLAEMYSAGRKPKAVFAIDHLYGDESSQVQYLERNDASQYIQTLLQHADELALDGSTLRGIHMTALVREKGEGKKTTAFKEKVLYFLSSHIVAWRSAYGRAALLLSLLDVHSAIKLELLLPLLRQTVAGSHEQQQGHVPTARPLSPNVAAYLVKIFDDTAVSSLDDPANDSFHVLKTCITVPLENALGQAVYGGVLDVLRSDVPQGLNRDRLLELFQLCLDTVASTEQAHTLLKQAMSDTMNDTSVITDLIKAVRPADETSEPSAKRAKKDDSSSDASSVSIRRLSLLVEIVSTKTLPGDIGLISVLLETLGLLSNSSAFSNVDVDYTQQLMLLAIMNNASALNIETPRSSNALRIDIIVDLIRSTANPQTSRQALLTVGSLARLSNESVLHNIMPIFMFMGSTVFQNDDAYSFSVISKTIDSIVPVMANSLRQQETTKFDLYLRSRDFLRVFTDASTHIPRHRRSKFFIHLVNVLGPQEFLAPLCMLLVDNVAFRVVKQKAIDLPTSFSIPLACLQKRPISERLSVLLEVLEECQRLCKRLADANHVEPLTFLDMSKSFDAHERVPRPEVIITRQIQALLLFVSTSIELLRVPQGTEDTDLDGPMQRFVSQLLELTVDTTEGKRDKAISTAAFAALDKAMNVVSVPTFAHAVLSMLATEDQVLQSAALLLLGRLNSVTARARRSIAPTMGSITARVVILVKQAEKDAASVQALQALELIARTAMAGEDNALAQAMGPVIQFAGEKPGQQQLLVLNILDIVLGKLGTLLIPNLLATIELCGSIISTSNDADLRTKAFGVLSGVLKALPNFIGSYLTRILDIALDVSRILPDDVEAARQGVLRSTAKHISGKTVLPALEKAWRQRETGRAPSLKFLSLYLDLLQRSLRAAERAEVVSELRTLFKLFLDIFDVRATYFGAEASSEFAATESTAIGAFLQVVSKLNESAFKPLFRRLYDWHLEGANVARGVTFYRLLGALLDQLKAIITPYMAILFDRTIELLREYVNAKADSGELWTEVLDVLRKSFEYDEGAFWRDNTRMRMMTPLVDQIDVCPRIVASSDAPIKPADALSSCLSSLSKASSDDGAKALNLAIWMKARSDSVETKLCMLACAQGVWKRDGERLAGAGYAAETVAFLVECLEDESEAVENEGRAFQRLLTKLVGPLDALIDYCTGTSTCFCNV
ncbi:hypothetical protein CALCODRAFT_60703 [Calocera cornea HHB12733]|uniref:U3 small nucleolar RNA-associated protein 10 n=1 Tax=Calocera cornea HHB12733 TaxID=1353952 RepID=A0A165DNF1_9BASI|nr:hypothetical protein CALCODRAFT_60703 [Calocera cornea HHB12733]